MINTKTFIHCMIFLCATNFIPTQTGQTKYEKEENEMQSWFDQMQKYKTLDILDKNQRDVYINIVKNRPKIMPREAHNSTTVYYAEANAEQSDLRGINKIFDAFITFIEKQFTKKESLNHIKKRIANLQKTVNEKIVIENSSPYSTGMDLFKWYTIKNLWYPKIINLLKETIDTIEIPLRNQFEQKKQVKEKKTEQRAPEQIVENSLNQQPSPLIVPTTKFSGDVPDRKTIIDSTTIPAYENFARAKNYTDYDNFFVTIDEKNPQECIINRNQTFESQFPIVWPCKIKYTAQLIKQYHPNLSQELDNLSNIVIKFCLFMRNKDNQIYNKKEKIEELKTLIKPLKSTFFSKVSSAFKSKKGTGQEKEVEKVFDALKKTLVSDVEKYAK